MEDTKKKSLFFEDECHHPENEIILTNREQICGLCGLILQQNHITNDLADVYPRQKEKNDRTVQNAYLCDLYRQRFESKDINGKPLHAENRAQFKRFNKIIQKRSIITNSDKKKIELLNLSKMALNEFNININSVLHYEINRLIDLCKNFNNQGRTKNDLICAIFYIAHKNLQIPIRYNRLIQYFEAKSKCVYRIIGELYANNKIKRNKNAPLKKHFIRILNENFPMLVKENFSLLFQGARIASFIEQKIKGNYNCHTVSSGICYYLFKFNKVKISQKGITKILKVSDCSIRKWSKLVEMYLHFYQI